MYEAYWGLSRSPFQNDADPEFFYPSPSHRAALLKLRYVLDRGLGAGVLLGGTGYGKTYLAHRLASEAGDEFAPVVHVRFPQLTSSELLNYLAVELGADESEIGRNDGRLDRTLRTIEQQLRRHGQSGSRPTIIIDEAHLIDDPRALQTLQLLLNFQQLAHVWFSLILVGDRSLLPRLGRTPQLDERIGVKSLLQPLSRPETGEYVAHRLAVAGTTRAIFGPSALDAIFELSGGVPRRINRLCDLALLVGFADVLSELTAADIESVAEELTLSIAA